MAGRSQEMKLLILLGLAFFIGLVVLVLKPDYRVADNLQSNAGYYLQTTDTSEEYPVDNSRPPMVEF